MTTVMSIRVYERREVALVSSMPYHILENPDRAALMDARRIARKVYARLFSPYDYSSHVFALHEYRAIYIAVPKVANTSIKTALVPLMPDDVRSFEGDARGDRSIYGRHRDELFSRSIRLYKHQIKRYPSYFKFAFVRNPWDRLVSCFRDKIEWGAVMESGRHNDPRKRRMYLGSGFTTDMTFDDFARKVAKTPDSRANRHFRSQHTFLTDRHGRLIPDFVGRFERLSEDFARVMEHIGVSDVRLPHVRDSRGSRYREYYTSELVDLVARRYARDVDLFDYDFEGTT